jgi:alpha-L-fucosidase
MPEQFSLPVPSPRQVRWHQLELYGFLHFTVNTFTDKEWGYGDESPAIFNPSDFDADQIVSAARAGGLKALILTCKHHDGFCLWPSAYTEHSVKNSPWRAGKGDMVAEISQACARQGLRFGVYLSPWDRNHADYGRPAYIEYYRSQLRELLENYGPIFEVWFDGANGGDGYYGGANEVRTIDKTQYYDWQATWQLVRELQPDACMFSDAGPDIRWVGNENGIAGDPCWSTLSPDGMSPGLAEMEVLNQGMREGSAWLPAECDVSIRPGWFYHAHEDAQVKTPEYLLDLYTRSVGRGASLLINLPPDRRGRIFEADALALRQFQQELTRIFQTDLARPALPIASSNAGPDAGPERANDGNLETYWLSGVESAGAELILDFPALITFTWVSLREYIPLGQRVGAFALDAWEAGGWVELARGESIGNRRLLRLEPHTAQKLRLRILSSSAPAAITEFAVYQG